MKTGSDPQELPPARSNRKQLLLYRFQLDNAGANPLLSATKVDRRRNRNFLHCVLECGTIWRRRQERVLSNPFVRGRVHGRRRSTI